MTNEDDDPRKSEEFDEAESNDASPPDHFPSTQWTWIHGQMSLGHEGQQEIRRHIMAVYSEPLQIYYRGTRIAPYLGDSQEIIHDFFAGRLGRKDFFSGWEESGKPLRRWLMNAVCLHLKDLIKQKKRDGRIQFRDTDFDLSITDKTEEALDQAFLRSAFQEALKTTEEECQKDNLEGHFDIFVRHYLQREKYRQIATDLGLTTGQAAGRCRAVMKRFEVAVRDLFERDGGNPIELLDS